MSTMSWSHLLKRAVDCLTNPAFLALLLLFIAIPALYTVTFRRFGRLLVVLTCLVLAPLTFPFAVRRAASLFEKGAPPIMPSVALPVDETAPPRNPYAIIILGAGIEHPGDAGLPALSRLGERSLARLAEGVRLSLQFPEAKVIITTVTAAMAAKELGVAENRLVVLPRRPADTGEEAAMVKGEVGDRPVLLVTSALHMPRAMRHFAAAKVEATPSGCDFISTSGETGESGDDTDARWRPSGKHLAAGERMIHEMLGWVHLFFSNIFSTL